MDEFQARDVLAVKAIETHDRTRALLSDADRAWGTRAAAEVVTAGASDEAFLVQRSHLVLERLREQQAGIVRAVMALHWRPWITPVVLATALLLGLAADRIGGAGRVNILAPPLLGLFVWNLGVYVVLLGRTLATRRVQRHEGPLRRFLQSVAAASRPERALRGPAAATAAFRALAGDWMRAVGRLYALRTARLLHLAAATLALGALLGMYARGLVFEYRAAWESTFLDAQDVHRLLTFVLTPAARLSGLAIPSAEHLATLRVGASPGGENAALWLHLYAMTIVLVVLAPRALLALGAGVAERRLRSRLAVPLDDGYFRRLTRSFREGPMRVRLVPYSVDLQAGALAALTALFERAFGRCEVSAMPPVPYGTEPDAGVNLGGANLVVALFTATATPEAETHGAFVRGLTHAASGSDCLAVVDESAFRERWPRDDARLGERRAAWEAVLAPDVPVLFLHLARLDVDTAGAALDRALQSGS